MSASGLAQPTLPILDRAIYIGLAVLLAGVAAVLAFSLSGVTKEANALQWELQVRDLLFLVAVPDEALYVDAEGAMEVASARLRLFARNGNKTFVPFAQMRHPEERLTFTPQGVAVDDLPATDLQSVVMHSLEQSWNEEVFRACTVLAAEVELEDGLGGHLRENKPLYEERIKAPMTRLLSSTNNRTRYGAVLVLMVFGDRSVELVAAVNELAELQDGIGEHIREVRGRYGI